MHKRKSGNGRPSGTDGSDFSYRMVVDNRYTRVAKGKSRLSLLIFAQATIQLLAAVNIFLSKLEEESLDRLGVASLVVWFISLIIGELGRKRSRVNFLKFFVTGSSIALLLSIACLTRCEYSLEVLKDFSSWGTLKLEFFKIGAVLLGSVIQIVTVSTTLSLIHNMKPPKKAS